MNYFYSLLIVIIIIDFLNCYMRWQIKRRNYITNDHFRTKIVTAIVNKNNQIHRCWYKFIS